MSGIADSRLPVVLPGRRVPTLHRPELKARRVLALVLQGESRSKVAEVTGYAESTVSAIMRNPLSAKLLVELNREGDVEFQALRPLAIDALRRGLNSTDDDTALRASRDYFNAKGKDSAQDQGVAESAEDIVERILELQVDGPATVRVAERARRIPTRTETPVGAEDLP